MAPPDSMGSAKPGVSERFSGPYQLFMLALCVFALTALAVETLAPLTASTRQILEVADAGICILFFGDSFSSSFAHPTGAATSSGGDG
jgi:hypothetical protein